jgi:hypothetical protein
MNSASRRCHRKWATLAVSVPMLAALGAWLLWFRENPAESGGRSPGKPRVRILPGGDDAGGPLTRRPQALAKEAALPADNEVLVAAFRRNEAEVAARSLRNSVVQFIIDYGHFPGPVSAKQGTDCVSDTSAAGGLIHILAGRDDVQNTRHTDYVDDLREAMLEKGMRKDGLVRGKESTALVDPWGNYYAIALDLDGNETLDNPRPKAEPAHIYQRVLVWSAGPDGDFATWEDNITSWEVKP